MDVFAGGGKHLHGNSFDRDEVARLDHHVLDGDALQNLNVIAVVLFDHARVLHVGAVIDEGADLHAVGELWNATHVIAMVMGDENVIQLFDFGGFGGLHDALGVAAVETAPAGIDQKRLSGRAYDQRSLAALHVDKIDLKRFGGEGRASEGKE